MVEVEIDGKKEKVPAIVSSLPRLFQKDGLHRMLIVSFILCPCAGHRQCHHRRIKTRQSEYKRRGIKCRLEVFDVLVIKLVKFRTAITAAIWYTLFAWLWTSNLTFRTRSEASTSVCVCSKFDGARWPDPLRIHRVQLDNADITYCCECSRYESIVRSFSDQHFLRLRNKTFSNICQFDPVYESLTLMLTQAAAWTYMTERWTVANAKFDKKNENLGWFL